MKCLFIINQSLDGQHLENQYLLMIAMLNFEFEVNVVFTEKSFTKWQKDPKLNKHLNALSLYGAENHVLSNTPDSSNSKIGYKPINIGQFFALKNNMAFIS